MKTFIVACVAAFHHRNIGGFVLDSTQEPADKHLQLGSSSRQVMVYKTLIRFRLEVKATSRLSCKIKVTESTA